MGTYVVSENELYDALIETLDNIEGDFRKQTLLMALERCKEYKYTVG